MPQAPDLKKTDMELLRNAIHILEFLHDAIVIFNPEGRLIFANHAYENILGVSLNKILGEYLYQIEPDADALRAFDGKTSLVCAFTFVRTVNKYVTGDAIPLFDSNNQLAGVISIFRDMSDVLRLSEKLRALCSNQRETSPNSDMLESFSSLKGKNEKFLSILSFASQVAKTDMTVLIQGESGVGKDLLAMAIHRESPRKYSPFIAVNCAAISETLWESELFGYEPGSFTGAKTTGKKGKFEAAQGGTLFLDEVSEITLPIQAKLLRVLQNGEIEKIGSTKTVRIDTRIIAATNKNLRLLVDDGKFRTDLFFRLHVIPIALPPLRERRGDIPLLANDFLSQYSKPLGRAFRFSDEAQLILENYFWPGNIRELENVIQYALVHSRDGIIKPLDFPEYLWSSTIIGKKKDKETLHDAVFEAEKNAFIGALKDSGNNRSKAMQILGVSRKTFYKKLREFGLK
ncbi:MAG: sigma 54-interacting transcriptional regulator [Peptococcaceae bacterium]|nr:sigma 54-interacting transcriptional regulator [Peptococcaceae bacterium]